MHSRRIDLEREISIRVPAFDAFVTEYSANISATGMFIRSDKPLPPETQLAFEFKIADDWKLIRGKATVVWSRYRNEGPDQPSGMGILFTELEPQSRRLIAWIIEKHVREGGTPFDLGELSEPTDLDDLGAAAEPASEPAAPAAARTPARARQAGPPPRATADRPKAPLPPEPIRFRLGPLILAGLAVTLVLAGLFWLSERGAQSIANPEPSSRPPSADAGGAADASPTPGESPTVADPSPEDDPAATATATSPGADPPSAASSPAASPAAVSPVFLEAVRRLVDGWSRAWSEQDVDAYLSHYSRSFRPADGRSRSAWAAERRQRLQAPAFIEISVSDLEAEVVSESRGRATFEQGYRSDTYEDKVRKVLELVREDGRWRILEETSDG